MSDVTDTFTAVFTGGIALPIQAREERKAAERDTERARQEQRKIQSIKAARERRRAVREARIQRADIEAGAVASGTSSSSSAQLGAGAVGTQLAANLSFLDEVQQRTQNISMFQEAASAHQGRAADRQQLFDVGKSVVSLFAGGA